MNAILVSVPPKVCERIANGEQTILLMKRIPKLNAPYKVYIYKTKKPVAVQFSGTGKHISEYDKTYCYHSDSGKVIGSFVCDNEDEFRCCYVPYRRNNNLGYGSFIDNGVYQIDGDDGVVFERPDTRVDSMLKNDDLSRMCISAQDLYKKIGEGNKSCTLHISDLKIYDTPKELGEFRKPCKVPKKIPCSGCGYASTYMERCERPAITHLPMSWCYVEELSE